MFDSVIRFFGGKKTGSAGGRSAYAQGFERGRRFGMKYDAAGPDEDNARHWQAGVDSNSADAANSPAVRRKIRQRARYETDNNGYLSGVVETLVNDIAGVGPNIQLSDAIPEAAAEMAEADWADWRIRAGIDDALQIMVRSKIIDGEAFALLTTPAGAGEAVALSLSPIECEQVSDPNASNDPLNIDGVLLDSSGQVKGYRMLKDHPGGLAPSNDTVDVKPGEMLHWFRRRRPGQHRGVSDLAPALKLGALLRRYSIATVRTAEFQAAQGGVIESNAADGTFDEDILPEDVINVERGNITAMPVGYRFKGFEPTQPNSNLEMFERNVLQEIGRGLNVPLVVTLMNASGFNFASGRLDHLVYWKHIRIERARFARQVIQPLFQAWWREWRGMKGYGGLPDFPRVEFIFPGFDFLDVARESSAHKDMIESGLETPAEYWISRGKDPEQQRREVERWAEWRRKHGFAQGEPNGGQGGQPGQAPAPEGEPTARPFEQRRPDGRMARAGEWRESDHPRADDGKFGEGAGSGEGKGSEGEGEKNAEAVNEFLGDDKFAGERSTNMTAKLHEKIAVVHGNTQALDMNSEAGKVATDYVNQSSQINAGIKAHLRTGGEVTSPIAAMDQAIAGTKPLGKDIYVYRALPKDVIKKAMKEGGFGDHGFSSTSLDKMVAKNDFKKQGNTVIKILLPKGAHGLYMPKAIMNSDNTHLRALSKREQEYLLPRGGWYKRLRNNTYELL